MAKSSNIIRQCYMNLTDAVEKYQDNWMCDETWVRVISSRYPDVINSIGFSRTTFIRAISTIASHCGTQNNQGIFRHQFKTSCPYDSGQRRDVSYFYRQVDGKPPAAPSGPHNCKDVHVRARPIRLSTAERDVTRPLSIMPQSTDHGIEGNQNDGNENNACSNGGGGGEEEGGDNLGPIAVVTPHRIIQRGDVSLGNSNKPVYWDSPEAAILFGFNEGDDVYNKLGERVTLLKGALQKPDGYKSILQRSEEPLNADQVFKIRNKCVFLIQAYQIALEKLGTNNTRWKKDCCQEAVNRINDIGFDTTINANTLMNWNIDFRKYEQFHHPDIHVANNIKPTPAMFEYFPQAAVDASFLILIKVSS